MNPFARLAVAGPVADALSGVLPDRPLLRTGLTTVGMRYALGSLPVALAVIGAGFAWRKLRKDRPETQVKRKLRKKAKAAA